MRYIHYDSKSLIFKNFYLNRGEGTIEVPEPFLKLDEDLWDYLHNLQEDFKVKEAIILKEIYTIEDKYIFEIIPFVYEEPKPSRTDTLEEQNAQMIIDSAEKDAKIEELNQTVSQLILEIAQGGM